MKSKFLKIINCLKKRKNLILDKNASEVEEAGNLEDKLDSVFIDNLLSKERRDKMAYCPHIMISGKRGVGVNFASKWLLNKIIKNTNDKMIIIDMFGDYKEICNNVSNENCTIVHISNDIYLNPLEIVNNENDDIFHTKFDFLAYFFEFAIGRTLTKDEKRCLDMAYKSIKKQCNKTFDYLYTMLDDINSKDARTLRDSLYPYLELNTYNTSGTNISSKIIYVDLSRYSSYYKEVAFMFTMEWASNQMKKNLEKGIFTCVCIPFMDNLKHIPEKFVSDIVKRARIQGGKFFFVTYEIESFANRFRGAFNNIATLLLLNQSDSDFEFIKECWALSDSLKNPDTMNNHEGLLIEGQNVSICRFNT